MRIEGGHRTEPPPIQHRGSERNNRPKALPHEEDVPAINVGSRLQKRHGIERVLGAVLNGIARFLSIFTHEFANISPRSGAVQVQDNETMLREILRVRAQGGVRCG